MPSLVSVRDLCDDAEDRVGTQRMLAALNYVMEKEGWKTETILSIPSETGPFMRMSCERYLDSAIGIGHGRVAYEIAEFLQGLPSDPDRPLYLTGASFLRRGWEVSVRFRRETN